MSGNWPTKKWTADEDAVLLREYDNGTPYSDIAKLLPGRTKNSCIGRAFRLGLCEERYSSAQRALDTPA